jgi:hypothetical protein
MQCLYKLPVLVQNPFVVLMASGAGLFWDLMTKIVKFYSLKK